MTPPSKTYGILAEFGDPEALVAATRTTHAAGYKHIEAYTPFPMDDLNDALELDRTPIPLLTLLAGLSGAAGGYFMCWYANVISYPINIGGRPFNSWPAWIPLTFELGVLCAGLTAGLSMLILNGLPEPHHPLFNAPEFELASQTKFFLCIEARDEKYNSLETPAFLLTLHPTPPTSGL